MMNILEALVKKVFVRLLPAKQSFCHPLLKTMPKSFKWFFTQPIYTCSPQQPGLGQKLFEFRCRYDDVSIDGIHVITSLDMNSFNGSSELTASLESSDRDTQDEDDIMVLGGVLKAKYKYQQLSVWVVTVIVQAHQIIKSHLKGRSGKRTAAMKRK